MYTYTYIYVNIYMYLHENRNRGFEHQPHNVYTYSSIFLCTGATRSGCRNSISRVNGCMLLINPTASGWSR